jgi:hypothetical protein
MKPIWDECITHSNVFAIAQVFTTKLDYGLSETGYDKILKWRKKHVT